MATAQEGGATGNDTASTSSYGGTGAGGKFRKKPIRRQTTPYDRPPTSLRANVVSNNNSNSWLTRLVVDPASRLISYGANRLFASLSRKRLLPPPPPPQPPEVNHDMNEGPQGAVSYNQLGAIEPTGGESTQLINSFGNKGISELEQLLQQKTFTKSEINHLTEILQSRATEGSLGNKDTKMDETTTIFGRHDKFASGTLDELRNERIRSPGVTSTPILESKVLENNLGSPADLAKAYMGSRPSKVSPSMLGMHSQVGREGTGLLNSIPFASKSPITSLTTKTSVNLGAPENGFITPRSRGRSAIYNMARSPYSRFRATSIHMGSGVKNDSYAGLLMPSPSPSLVKHDEKLESKPMTLKRRSSVVDDEVGSVGPLRRIRQKHNLFAPGTPHITHGVGTSSAKQKLPLIGGPRENENKSVINTSSTNVPSKSSEVASRILQHLENLTPKEKSSVSKIVSVREKSPFKLTPSMLRGQALRSLENVDSSRLLLDVQDDHKLEDRSNATLTNVRDSTSQNNGKVENGPKEFVVPFDKQNPVKKVFLKASETITENAYSVVSNGVSQPPQKKRVFRMSAQEDYLDLDDDIQCNGTAIRPISEGRRPEEVPLFASDLSPTEDPRSVENIIPSEVESPSDLVLRKPSQFNGPGSVKIGEGSTSLAFHDSNEASSASASVLPSGAAVDKLKEANNPPPLFTFSSKISDRFSPSPSESSKKMQETKLEESSSSLVNTSGPTGFESKSFPSDKDGHLTSQKVEDRIEKSDSGPSATSNGLYLSKPPAISFTTTSLNDTSKISTGGSFLLTSSTSLSNFPSTGTGTDTSAASSGSIFGSAMAPATLSGPASKFSASIDPPTAFSSASASKISEVGDSQAKAEINQSYGSSSSSLSSTPAFAAAISGSSIFGLATSHSHSTADNVAGSLFSSASKSSVFGVGTIPQSSSVESVLSASLPSFNMSSSMSFGSSLSNSQAANANNTFGYSSSASSLDTSAVVHGSGPVLSVAKFGASSTTVSDGNAVSSSSNPPPGIFSFGLNPPSTSTNAVGSSSGATLPMFSFGAGASVPASTVNTSSSFSTSTSGVFNFGGSSSASSSAMNSITSNSAPSNVFGSSWQSPNSSVFGSTNTSSTSSNTSLPSSSGFVFGASSTSSNTSLSPSTGFTFGASSASSNTSLSPSTGFAFGASSASSAPTNASPAMFNSSTGASFSPAFSFTGASASGLSTPSQSFAQPVFGISPSSFAASPGNSYPMNGEDSMAEDPVQSSASVFGQPPVPPSPLGGFAFGQSVPSQSNPFQFGGQQNQVAPLNSSPFQASNSLEFNAGGGGSFSLGSGGGDKSNRKFVRVNKNRNRKK